VNRFATRPVGYGRHADPSQKKTKKNKSSKSIIPKCPEKLDKNMIKKHQFYQRFFNKAKQNGKHYNCDKGSVELGA